MQRNSIRGDRASGRPLTAEDLGWDETLYADDAPHGERGGRRGGNRGDRLPRQRAGRSTLTPDCGHDPPTEEAGHGRGRRGGTPRSRTRAKRRLLRWFVLILSLLILVTAGVGYLYYRHLNGNLARGVLNLGDNQLGGSKPNAAGQTPLNILLLGSDSRDSAENIRLGGSRRDAGRKPLADVQMLLHVSADRSNISAITIPRDTRVTIPKCTDPEDHTVYPQTTTRTINTSLQNGGPGCSVATWEKLTGIPIDHFMMIDFAGVVSMADAVGGVPVCVDDNVHDSRSKLRLERGETVIKGEQALQWLRTRHGFEDGSDLGRAKAQHMYMTSMVRQLKAGSQLGNPGRMRGLAEAATRALTVDEGLGSVKKLFDLGNDISRVPTERITMTTMPWQPDPADPAHVIPSSEADELFAMVRNDKALDGKDKPEEKGESGRGEGTRDGSAGSTEKEQATDNGAGPEQTSPDSGIPVLVQNGTGSVGPPVVGRAAAVSKELIRLGFTQALTDATPRSQAYTTIDYAGPDQHGNALVVAKALGLPDRAVKHSAAVDQVTVVIGADWREGASYPKASAASYGKDSNGGSGSNGGIGRSRAPASADALSGGDRSACMSVNPGYVW